MNTQTLQIKRSSCFQPGFPPNYKKIQPKTEKLMKTQNKIDIEKTRKAFQEIRNQRAEIVKKTMKF